MVGAGLRAAQRRPAAAPVKPHSRKTWCTASMPPWRRAAMAMASGVPPQQPHCYQAPPACTISASESDHSPAPPSRFP